jgi:uncharacterized protein (TIGR02391 family)
MATRKAASPPPAIEVKQWASAQEIDKAVAKLQKRITEAEALDVRRAAVDNTGEIDAVVSSIRHTILELFGERSPEYTEHSGIQMWDTSVYVVDDAGIANATERGRNQVINALKGLIARLQEKREELGEGGAASPKEVIRVLNLHPRIADVAADLFEDGYHWEAVFAGAKALVNLVKERSEKHELDGAPLVRAVFSRNDPILAFNELKDQTDLDEQEGMMHLFEGAVLGIRNPGGHSFPEGPQQRAAEYLSLLSLLAYRTAEAKRRRKP